MGVGDVVAYLGGPDTLSEPVTTELDLALLVDEGLPTASLDAMVRRGALSQDEVEELIIPRRTLAHRRQRHEPLTRDESDRLARAARVIASAAETFQNGENAGVWLRRPNRALRGARPIDLVATSGGARVVEDVLLRLAHGMFS